MTKIDPSSAPVASYAFAHGGKTLFWTASDLYFVFFMNEVCGIAPWLTGLIVGASFCIAAAADLGFGVLFSKSGVTPRTAGRLQRNGAIASSASLILFAGAAFIPAHFRLPACLATLVIFRIAYAIIDVPQNALLALASQDKDAIITLAAARNITGGVAKISVAAMFVPLFAGAATNVAAGRFALLSTSITFVATASALILERQLPKHVPKRLAAAPPTLSTAAASQAVQMFIASIFLTGFVQLEPYLATFAIQDPLAGSMFMGAIAGGGLVSQPTWRRRYIKAPAAMWTEALAVVAMAALGLLLVPIQSVFASSAVGFLYGVGSGGVLLALWTGISRDAAGASLFWLFAGFSAAGKIGQGLAIVTIGLILERLGGGADPYFVGVVPETMAILLLVGSIALFVVRPGSRPRLDTPTVA